MRLEIVAVSGRNAPAVDDGTLSRPEFDRVRNKLVVACARYGTVGPSGQLPVEGHEVVSVGNPDFYIVEDQYNDDRRLIVEPLPEKVSARWLEAVSEAMEPASGWDVLLRLGGGIDLIVSPGRVRVFGYSPVAVDLDALVEELRRNSSN